MQERDTLSRILRFTSVHRSSCRYKPARDRRPPERWPVHGLRHYLQEKPSIGGSRWAVTVAAPCPRFPVQGYAAPQVPSASRRVTARQSLRLLLCGGSGRGVDVAVPPRGSPVDCFLGGRAPVGVGAVVGSSRSTSSERILLLSTGGTSNGRSCTASGECLSVSTFTPYRTGTCVASKPNPGYSFNMLGTICPPVWVNDDGVGNFSRAGAGHFC
jgi:hypothetical protein